MNTHDSGVSSFRPSLPTVPTPIWIRFAIAGFLILFPASYGIRVAMEINRAEPYLEAADIRQEQGSDKEDLVMYFDGDPVDGSLLYWPVVLFGATLLSLMTSVGVYLLWPLVKPWPVIGVASGAVTFGLIWIPPILGHHVIDGVSSYL